MSNVIKFPQPDEEYVSEAIQSYVEAIDFITDKFIDALHEEITSEKVPGDVWEPVQFTLGLTDLIGSLRIEPREVQIVEVMHQSLEEMGITIEVRGRRL